MIKLKQGQGLIVGSGSYVVTGCVSYRRGADTWDEYTLKNARGGISWLSVDNHDGEYVLSTVANSRRPPADYKLVDQGIVVVTGRFGNTDVDIGERVRFAEYEDAQRVCTFSVEEWDDETEYSQGHYIHDYNIQLLDTPPFEYKASSSKESILNKFGTIIAAVVGFIILSLSSCFESCMDSCEKCSPSDPNYTQCQSEYNSCMRARSIRQSSRKTRRSSGGGMHSGK